MSESYKHVVKGGLKLKGGAGGGEPVSDRGVTQAPSDRVCDARLYA